MKRTKRKFEELVLRVQEPEPGSVMYRLRMLVLRVDGSVEPYLVDLVGSPYTRTAREWEREKARAARRCVELYRESREARGEAR